MSRINVQRPGLAGSSPADNGGMALEGTDDAAALDSATGGPVHLLRRWEDFGATWCVVGRGDEGVTVSLRRCDGGEEMSRLVSNDPELLAFLVERESAQ